MVQLPSIVFSLSGNKQYILFLLARKLWNMQQAKTGFFLFDFLFSHFHEQIHFQAWRHAIFQFLLSPLVSKMQNIWFLLPIDVLSWVCNPLRFRLFKQLSFCLVGGRSIFDSSSSQIGKSMAILLVSTKICKIDCFFFSVSLPITRSHAIPGYLSPSLPSPPLLPSLLNSLFPSLSNSLFPSLSPSLSLFS